MLKGIDVSENNGYVNWNAVKAAGMDFAIIRLGFGNRHLDTNFYENVNGALAAGLKIGVYYYSYALDEAAARSEAGYMLSVLDFPPVALPTFISTIRPSDYLYSI